MPKMSKEEKEEKIMMVAQWIIEGTPDFKLLQKIKKEFNVKIRQARNYKTWARERIRPDNDLLIEDMRTQKILEIQHKCSSMSSKYLKTPSGLNAWVNAQKLLISLTGIEPEKKIKISGDGENPISIVWHEEKTYLQPEEETDDE